MGPKSGSNTKNKKKGKYKHKSRPKPEIFTQNEIIAMTDNFRFPIGSGNNGEVFRGIHDGKPVAVKRYQRGKPGQGKVEIKCLWRFHHQNIISLIGYCKEKTTYIVMEYLPRNLREAAEIGIGWVQTMEILKQIARGVQHIHKRKYILGDLKPENVLVDDDGKIKLCDFGQATKLGEDAEVFNNGYSAPEVVGIVKANTQQDAFSFGIIMLELLMKNSEIGCVKERNRGKRNYKNNKGKKKNKEEFGHIIDSAKKKEEANQAIVSNRLISDGCTEEAAHQLKVLVDKCVKNITGMSRQDMINNPERGRPKFKEIIHALTQILPDRDCDIESHSDNEWDSALEDDIDLD